MQEKVDIETIETDIWQQYQNGLAYQKQMGFVRKIPEFVKFFEGNQWATPTKKTKNLPRPVLNIIKFICRNKKSAIQATPVKLVFKADNEKVDAEKFTKFVEYIQKEIGQSSLDSQALDDGIKKGSYFYHYYWDSEAKGKNGIKEGALRCDVIDILDIFFANPLEVDEQKQEWIIIASRESVKAIREKADSNIDQELIQPDESELKYGEKEQDGSELCTILTKYYRVNGEVFCTKATKTTVVNKPFALTPDIASAEKEVGLVTEDAPNNNLPDNDEDLTLDFKKKFELYPIVVGNYELREKSIYGLGEIEGLLPNQKAINFNFAMSLLNAEELAWGKWKVTPDALKGQQITNEPGQVLIDHSRAGNGITRLEAQQFNTAPLSITDKLIENTRSMTGATEVMSGEVIGANMSGSAIAYLQAQSQQPIDELKNRFWDAKRKQGKVIEQFAELFYTFDKEFSYEQIEEVKDNEGKVVNKKTQASDIFNGEDYQGTDFTVVCEATTGTKSSTSGDINMLDALLSKGVISATTYIKAYPEDALSNKTELLKMVEADEQREINTLKQQNLQYAEKLTEMTNMVQQQKEVVDKAVSAIKEMNTLKSYIVSLYSEATGKINEQNETIRQTNAKLAETTEDATYFAQQIASGLNKGNSSGVL